MMNLSLESKISTRSSSISLLRIKKVKVYKGGDSSIIINEPIDRLILCFAGELRGNMILK